MSLSPDNKLLYVYGVEGVAVFDAEKGDLLHYNLSPELGKAIWSPNGRGFLSINGQGNYEYTHLGKENKPLEEGLVPTAWSPEGESFYAYLDNVLYETDGLGVGQGKGRGQGQGRGNSDKGIQNAMNRGNGEKKGLIDQLLSTESTQYLYDGMNVFKEYGENAQPLAQYYYADGQVLAKKMFGLHGRKSDSYLGNLQTKGGLLYYQQDALGNIMDVTDRTGDMIQSYRYDVFGNLFTQMAAPYNTMGMFLLSL